LEDARAYKARIDRHIAKGGSPEERFEDEGEWFPSGSGYFTKRPHIVRRVWEEEVVL
jgi:hypothetical protein